MAFLPTLPALKRFHLSFTLLIYPFIPTILERVFFPALRGKSPLIPLFQRGRGFLKEGGGWEKIQNGEGWDERPKR